MARSVNARKTTVLGMVVSVETRSRLAELTGFMGRELGTTFTMGQALERAVTEALARRARDGTGSGERHVVNKDWFSGYSPEDAARLIRSIERSSDTCFPVERSDGTCKLLSKQAMIAKVRRLTRR